MKNESKEKTIYTVGESLVIRIGLWCQKTAKTRKKRERPTYKEKFIITPGEGRGTVYGEKIRNG